MDRATEHLREEHRWIRLLLDCLDRLVEGHRTRGEFDATAAAELQSLLEHFVDGNHQEKEEAVLFPKVLECVERLRDAHARERETLECMRFDLFNASLGDVDGQRRFLKEAADYAALQREHIEAEDRGLLALAEQLLSPEDHAEVLAELRRREAEGLDPGEVSDRIAHLAGRLGVAQRPRSSGTATSER